MKNRLLLLVLGVLLLPTIVSAASNSMSISCDKTTIGVKESTKCRVTGSTDEEVSSVSGLLESGDLVTISDVQKDSSWEGDSENNLALYTADNKKNSYAIATFTLTAKETKGSSEVAFKNVVVTDAEFEESSVGDARLSITVGDATEPVKENPKTGAFLPIALVVVLGGVFLGIKFFKGRDKIQRF